MAVGHPITSYEFPRRRSTTMFPGRELPPPTPATMPETTDFGPPWPWFLPREEPEVQSYQQPSLPTPPPNGNSAHKVWMLNCKHCNKFITNRAILCNLVLRPDIQLFSSDAMPVNCSVYQYQATSNSPRMRTCECLTQTLCCHGCGTAIGYMIVAPCARCAPSMGYDPNNIYSYGQIPPNTIGHRFIFHVSQTSYEERLHVAGDPDVNRDAPSQEVYDAMLAQMQSTPHAQMPRIPRLRSGEFVYWYHLARGGDMMGGVRDDNRARASRGYRVDPAMPQKPLKDR